MTIKMPAVVELRQALGALEPAFRDELPMVRAVVVATEGGVVWESYIAGVERDVIWDGSATADRYQGPAYPLEATPDQLHSVKSVTKSVLALITGIAIERGLVPSVDLCIAEVLDTVPADKASIRLRDLLAMRSGLEWEENGDITLDYVRSGDLARFTLERQRVLHEPGAFAEYSTADSHLLGHAVSAAAGRPLEKLADEFIFEPLGITDYRWLGDSTNAVVGGSELFLRPRDMAKIGLAVLGGALVSAEWLDFVTTAQSDLDLRAWAKGGPASPFRTGYCHHWWRGRVAGHDVRFAHGLGGQTIQVYDALDAVVVTTADSRRDMEADPMLDPSLYLSDRYLVPALAGR
jgi:CubicO group peptidase (beta-lactamase class C family)